MINNVLKNFCLITFALIAPITLPAGGIQKSLNQNKFPKNANEIILSSKTSLYSCPEIYAKELLVLDIGTTLSVLRNWKVSKSETWVRVELASNKFLDDPNRILKGWIKILFLTGSYLWLHKRAFLVSSVNALIVEAPSKFNAELQISTTDAIILFLPILYIQI